MRNILRKVFRTVKGKQPEIEVKVEPKPIKPLNADSLTQDDMATFLRNFDYQTADPQNRSDIRAIIGHLSTYDHKFLLANLNPDAFKAFQKHWKDPGQMATDLLKFSYNSKHTSKIVRNLGHIGEEYPEALSRIGIPGRRSSGIDFEESKQFGEEISNNIDALKDSPNALKALINNHWVDGLRVALAGKAEHFAHHPDVLVALAKPRSSALYNDQAKVVVTLINKLPQIAKEYPESAATVLRETNIIDAVQKQLPKWRQNGTIDADHPLNKIIDDVSDQRSAFVQQRAVVQHGAPALTPYTP